MPTNVLKEHKSAHVANGELGEKVSIVNEAEDMEEEYVAQDVALLQDDIKHEIVSK